MPRTYAELPDAVSQNLVALGRRIRGFLDGGVVDVHAVERELVAGLSEVGLAVMREVLAGLDPRGEDVVVDGQRYWQAVRATEQYMCAFGKVTVERGVYRAVRNGPTVCPMELRAGVVEGSTSAPGRRASALTPPGDCWQRTTTLKSRRSGPQRDQA